MRKEFTKTNRYGNVSLRLIVAYPKRPFSNFKIKRQYGIPNNSVSPEN